MKSQKSQTPRSLAGLILAGLLAATSCVSAQNLLVDGGFELGQAPGTYSQSSSYGAWTSVGGTTALLGMPYAAPTLEGTNAMYLTGGAIVKQTFATIIGRQYQVGVSLNGWDAAESAGAIRVYNSAGTDLSGSFSCASGGVWEASQFTFTASGAQTSIELQGGIPALSIIDAVWVTLNPPAEVTVFGTGERAPLSTNYDTSTIIKKFRRSVLPSFFNSANRYTYSGSVVSSGTVTIEAGDPNGIFEQYHNRNDIKDLEIMAETVIIRSAWILKQTNVKIYARNLRFEASGSITTTGLVNPIPATDASSAAVPGGNGTPGVPGGSADVFVGTFSNTGGTSNPFNLTGGYGQAAGKGRHGTNGTSLGTYWGAGTVFNYGNASYTVPAGWYVTGHKFTSGSWGNGGGTWPGDGSNAWRSGTPGSGANGGTLSTNNSSIGGLYGAGAAGSPGVPTGGSGHYSTTVCEGGNAGWPVNSIQIYNWDSGVFDQNNHISEIARHTSTAGTSYAVPTSSAGSPGSRVITGSSYTWVNPALLRKIINDAKDDYLQNRLSRARTRFEDYSEVVTQYRADTAAWSGTPQMTQLEIGQMYDEMQILLQQIANGLDYFGNPAGWVPMLSFEVASNIFDQEIDRSLDIIYLTKWISTKQDNASETANALTTARDKLADEVADAQGRYATAATNLAGFQAEATVLDEKGRALIVQLEVKDNQLHTKALQNLKPPEWETALRGSLKVCGTICKMIPVYQPALGGVGDALNLGSDFDPDDPWATISGGLDLTTSYLNSGIQDAAGDQTTITNTASLDPTQLKAFNASGARASKLQSMSNASSALSGGISDMRNFLEKSKAPAGDVEKELEKLRAADPEYGALVTEIRELMTQKQDFADRILKGIREVAELSDLMTRDILAMDGLSVGIGANLDIIDSRVNSYLKDMERRAFDRLLKYHYYMAKAYEFRMVTPYTAQLNLENLFNQMLAIAEAPVNSASQGVLSGSDRNLLKGVFKNLIAETTQKIIDDYSVSGSTPGASINYELTPGDIAALNRGEAITLNLANRGLFLPSEEDIRIADIHVNGVSGIGTSGVYASPSYVEMCIEHSGLSNIKKDGQVYQFRHYNQSTRSAITWKSRYDPLGGTILLPPLVPASSSLLASLLPTLNTSELLLYARPGAWADLKIWRVGNNGGTTFGLGDDSPPITLDHVTLHIEFDRVLRLGNPARKTVEVLAARTTEKTNPTRDDEDDRMKPEFLVNNSDPNGRKNAVGRFVRIYNSGSPATVQVTAPAIYGDKMFWKWKDNGVDVAGAAGTNPTISVPTTGDHRLVAYFALAPDYGLWASTNIPAGKDNSFEGDWNGDGISNGISYVFGNTQISAGSAVPGVGRITSPGSIPADVDLYLERSSPDLNSWATIVSWVNGVAPTFAYPALTSIANGEVIDGGNVGKYFYRYRVVRR